ncbi:hypothetical protein ACFPOB_27180 [Bosea eneae]|uniref:Uncharacterized protein n=1 Tax=Bosea eneae TaxID=151454 RepID=A0ABW0J0R7_9HYPH
MNTKRFLVQFDFKPARCWRDDAYNLAKFDAWDHAERRKRGWRAGLSFWGRTNVQGSRVLIARHWPHLLCWSWSIWVSRYRKGYSGPRRFVLQVHRGYRFAEIALFGPSIRLSWQDSGWMPAVDRRGPDGAPKILWNHHLANAEAAGSA